MARRGTILSAKARPRPSVEPVTRIVCRLTGSTLRAGSFRGSSLQRGDQALLGVRVVVPRTVDVEGRRAVRAAPHAAEEIVVDSIGVDVLGKFGVEVPDVEPELLGVAPYVLVLEALLVL